MDKDLLAMGVNFSAIPDKASRQIMSRFAAKFENITSDEHGPSDNESEKWMQTLRSLDVGDILTKEDLNKVFFKREPENPPMVQFADPAFLDFLRQCKELGRGEESVDKAIATCEAAWKVLHEFDQYLEREPWKEREIERAVKSLMPHLPQDVPLDYYAFRDIARRQEEMKSKGWEWGSTLLHGVDPIYDRIDFRRVDFEDGRLQIMYVGDCVPGGYVEKEQVIVR
uniref:Uncharacterized protein n=1 Tax=Hanusia phi TaxID=3032 RepID=A0A6T7QAQ1_9CRYP